MPKSEKPDGSGKKPARLHDKFFKDVFQGAEYVTSLLRAGAPKALFEIIDWSTLSLASSSILVRKQPERIADLVFSVAIKSSEDTAEIVLLFEHKSSRDVRLELQVARNQFLMYLQNDFQSLIVPIVVLQGASVESGPIEFSNLFPNLSNQHKKILTEYSVNFQCLLINVNEIDRLGLAKQTNIDAVVRAMSQLRDANPSLLQELSDLVEYVQPQDRERMLCLLIGYVSDYNTNITTEDILNLQTETQEEQPMVLSAVDVFREEGRVEGREEVAVNLLVKGIELDVVVEVTKLSREKVEALRRENNNTLER